MCARRRVPTRPGAQGYSRGRRDIHDTKINRGSNLAIAKHLQSKHVQFISSHEYNSSLGLSLGHVN